MNATHPAGPKPDADVGIDEELVRALLSARHPDLAGRGLGFVDDGWDNAVYRLGPDLAVRLPRRAGANSLLLNELRWLPFLAPRLPVPIPVPVRGGKPGEGYPYHWAIMPWFEGRSAATVSPQERDGYAVRLAAFFRALHVPAPADAPKNPVRGVPLKGRDATVRGRLEASVLEARDGLLALWDEGIAAAEHRGPRLWVHGDPHPHNVVVGPGDQDGAGHAPIGLRAVIDFGDLTAGDPASDLAVCWLHFTDAGREAFRGALADHALYSPGTWVRARAWAVNYASLMAALPEADPLHAVGVHGIGQLLRDE
ncbi:aminoglycoside phosphotransferase family protein [Paeniglutamicibacter kerguelensis]|uniref:Aminoglycoside phosphotransferase (APT) family kinase protein n=1 Tax=Paeniglutamicibacter kerguelensis TaxID=254788 RepID=A0ABS4X961_9MICC|nr:aminoglycoside phosphotransferase family protein [Paeniglutamicibacter kerguelensis]MBP2385003.1 aminoglycoside phosphotransferase (APT) family kinase protein [Paeniglutamicibacter kerguelensis]